MAKKESQLMARIAWRRPESYGWLITRNVSQSRRNGLG
jgi:hypothetical protein